MTASRGRSARFRLWDCGAPATNVPAAVVVSPAREGRDKMMRAERKTEGSGEETAPAALSGKAVALEAGWRHAGGRNG